MGYTHYWTRTQKEIPQEKWDAAIDMIRPIIEKHRILLRDVDVTESEIFFNGTCETFYMQRIEEPREWMAAEDCPFFSFCKTRHDPYDKVVVACLVILATVLRDDPCGFSWSSDGTWPHEHDAGLDLVRDTALGSGVLVGPGQEA